MQHNINRREISVATVMCFLVILLSFSLSSLRRLVIDEYKAYVYKMEKSFEWVSLLDQVCVPVLGSLQQSEVGCLVWSEGVHSHRLSREKKIKPCMTLQYPGPFTGPSCMQASTEPYKSQRCAITNTKRQRCANYQSPLISSIPFEQGCRMTLIPPQSGPLPTQGEVVFSLKCTQCS